VNRTIEIDLEARRYPIHIGAGILGERTLLAPHVSGRHVFVVTNETVAPLYLDRLRPALADASGVDVHVIADGEAHKTLETFAAIQNAMVARRIGRDGVLIALGGGVVGDIAGFAAACYQRGVDFVQGPTTLLAQVDSSVGGKTGVNLPGGKNLVGAFHQPRCVLSDTTTLTTLDPREVRAGFAEIVKYGLIDDPGFFERLEAHVEALLALDAEALGTAVGINMTFVYGYTLIRRGWQREQRRLARFDIVMGLVLPYLLGTGLISIAAAAALQGGEGDLQSRLSPAQAGALVATGAVAAAGCRANRERPVFDARKARASRRCFLKSSRCRKRPACRCR